MSCWVTCATGHMCHKQNPFKQYVSAVNLPARVKAGATIFYCGACCYTDPGPPPAAMPPFLLRPLLHPTQAPCTGPGQLYNHATCQCSQLSDLTTGFCIHGINLPPQYAPADAWAIPQLCLYIPLTKATQTSALNAVPCP